MKRLLDNGRKFVVISTLALILLPTLYLHADSKSKLPTYFKYSQEQLLPMKKLSTTLHMNNNQLRKWDAIMFYLVKKNSVGGIPASRIYAYVYTAQRDAAYLSKNIKGEFSGSLEPVSSKVLCLFFSNDCKLLTKEISQDPYSNILATTVVEKIKNRIDQDERQTKNYPQSLKGNDYWVGQKPYVGHDTGSAMTWLISSPKAFLPPPPPAPQAAQWQHELQLVKKAVNNMTPEQKKALLYWAGDPPSLTLAGLWLKSANDYMDTLDTPLAKRVLIRSVLAMGLADSFTGVFHAKYTYWVKRPNMKDPSLVTVLETPNHPTYPAGHACISGTAASILSYYFPQKKQQWWQMARKAGAGRVTAGIHFPIDIQQGLLMGEKIGQAAVHSS